MRNLTQMQRLLRHSGIRLYNNLMKVLTLHVKNVNLVWIYLLRGIYMFISTLSMMEGHSMAGYIILLALGILLVIKGGDWFVDAASWIAEVSGIPSFIIGATIVSVATTLPEILVSSISAAQGQASMAIGNAVGSVNCNIALIMATSIVFTAPSFNRKNYGAKMCILLATIALLWGLSANGEFTWWNAILVLAMFVIFLVENLLSAKKHAKLLEAEQANIIVEEKEYGNGILRYFIDKKESQKIVLKKTGMIIERKDIAKNIILFIVGAGAIFCGAQLMSDNGAELARALNVPEGIIGVTILAVGTSLPEFVTAITAIIKKKSDLSVGNIIGANIIDLSLILPLCTFIQFGKTGTFLPVDSQSLTIDFPFCLAVAGFSLIPAFIMGKFKKWQGALLLAGYIAYVVLLILNTTGTITIF